MTCSCSAPRVLDSYDPTCQYLGGIPTLDYLSLVNHLPSSSLPRPAVHNPTAPDKDLRCPSASVSISPASPCPSNHPRYPDLRAVAAMDPSQNPPPPPPPDSHPPPADAPDRETMEKVSLASLVIRSTRFCFSFYCPPDGLPLTPSDPSPAPSKARVLLKAGRVIRPSNRPVRFEHHEDYGGLVGTHERADTFRPTTGHTGNSTGRPQG